MSNKGPGNGCFRSSANSVGIKHEKTVVVNSGTATYQNRRRLPSRSHFFYLKRWVRCHKTNVCKQEVVASTCQLGPTMRCAMHSRICQFSLAVYVGCSSPGKNVHGNGHLRRWLDGLSAPSACNCMISPVAVPRESRQ